MQERNALFRELTGLGLYESRADNEVTIDPTDVRIDVRAKFSLQRMLKQGGDAAADAEGMVTAINTGQLAGIEGDDTLRAVKVAKQLGTQRWLLVPKGKDAELVRVPAGPPSIIFREGLEKDKIRMDMALRTAWKSFAYPGIQPYLPIEQLPVLNYGAKGQPVIFLQRRLNVHGANLVEDGIWGQNMNQSVLNFQTKKKLKADGVVGPASWKRLNEEPSSKWPSNNTYSAFDSQSAATNPFSGYVTGSISVLDQDIADILFDLHRLPDGTLAKQMAVFAHHELFNGNLVGIVRYANADKIKNRIDPRHHPYVDKNAARNDNAVTVPVIDVGHHRAYTLAHNNKLDIAKNQKLRPGTTRTFMSLVFSHELTHFRNRVKARQMSNAPVDSNNFEETSIANKYAHSGLLRRGYIDELVARHVAWYVKCDVDQANKIPVIPLQPGQLYRGALKFALDFRSYKYKYDTADPDNLYMEDLSQRKLIDNLPYLFRRQVAKWMKVMTELDFHDDATFNNIIKAAIEKEYTFAEKTNFALPGILGRGFE